MKHITIRQVGPDLERALLAEKRRTGKSLNATVKLLLRRALGLSHPSFDNGLGHLAGSWTEHEYAEFESAVAPFEQVDEELWK